MVKGFSRQLLRPFFVGSHLHRLRRNQPLVCPARLMLKPTTPPQTIMAAISAWRYHSITPNAQSTNTSNGAISERAVAYRLQREAWRNSRLPPNRRALRTKNSNPIIPAGTYSISTNNPVKSLCRDNPVRLISNPHSSPTAPVFAPKIFSDSPLLGDPFPARPTVAASLLHPTNPVRCPASTASPISAKNSC